MFAVPLLTVVIDRDGHEIASHPHGEADRQL
jgi:hypothetical protein